MPKGHHVATIELCKKLNSKYYAKARYALSKPPLPTPSYNHITHMIKLPRRPHSFIQSISKSKQPSMDAVSPASNTFPTLCAVHSDRGHARVESYGLARPIRPIAERKIRKVVLRNRIIITLVIITIATSCWADMRAMYGWSVGNHVLMHHSAEEGVST